jgi:hypothetical protein
MEKADRLEGCCKEISKLREAIGTSIRHYLWGTEEWVREFRGQSPLLWSVTHPESVSQFRIDPGIAEATVRESSKRFLEVMWEVVNVLEKSDVEFVGETEEEHKERHREYMNRLDQLISAQKEVSRIQNAITEYWEENIHPYREGKPERFK